MKASQIIKKIVPWAIDKNASQIQYRSNYKGVRGRIGIVGGSRDYAGAPYFASISAMRLGADLAYVICSKDASSVIKNYSPDLIVNPLLDHPNESIFEKEMNCLLDRLHGIVIGPGLGREELLQNRAKTVIAMAKLRSMPLVLDADSLLLVNEDPSIIRSYPNVLLTPNRIEFQRLYQALHKDSSQIDFLSASIDESKKLVARCAENLGVTIMAKGLVDIINEKGIIDMVTDETSGSNRRCGGQGDILAGLVMVYYHWIQQYNKREDSKNIEHPWAWAAYLGAITTRRCNELAYKQYSNGMLASHMINEIHLVLDELLELSASLSSESTEFNYSGLLSKEEIDRYARQMILEGFGPQHQLKLKRTSALIIGAGGLGCPSSIYMAAAGFGRIGIVDNDRVEISNLHRQITHTVDRVGMLKTESIRKSIMAINPNVDVDCYPVRLTRENAVQLVEKYDMVIDATDNLVTRYLVSDACVVAKKPLISGAALRTDGQLTVYNYDLNTPCFRCLFPEPPKHVGSCSANGVLGMLPGIIGIHQALEAIKIGIGRRPSYAGFMLFFDGMLGTHRLVQTSPRRANCEACGENSKLDRDLIDYEKFCSVETCEKQPVDNNDILDSDERITVEQYRDILQSGEPHVLIDVRPKSHSDASRLSNALQIPVDSLLKDSAGSLAMIREELSLKRTNQIYVVCRRGIASQRGTRIIQDLFDDEMVAVRDIKGGMTAWAASIDSSYACV